MYQDSLRGEPPFDTFVIEQRGISNLNNIKISQIIFLTIVQNYGSPVKKTMFQVKSLSATQFETLCLTKRQVAFF